MVGPYRLLEELGRGGMGAVYRAEDTRVGRQVALKVMLSEVGSDPRFVREGEAVAGAKGSAAMASEAAQLKGRRAAEHRCNG